MSNTEIRTIPVAARAMAERWIAENPETVALALSLMIEYTAYLSMKTEWDMEDNFHITESLGNIFPIPALTDEETVEAASYFGLDADDLDDPYYDAHNRAMERAEEN